MALAGILAACQPFESIDTNTGDKVTVRFGVSLNDAAPSTRTLGETPVLSNLWVAVFDSQGYWVDFVQANELSGSGLEYTYELTLTASAEQRTLHFIANCPESWKPVLKAFGSERQIIPSLVSKDGDDAYWQRIVLYDGIKDAASLKAALDGKVELIRDFAKITVSSNDPKFVVKAIKVYNTPDRSYLAPYNANTGEFITDYWSLPYVDIIKEYTGTIPSDAVLIGSKTLGESDLIPAEGGKASDYVYERPAASSVAPYIIVKGSFDGKPDTYYKVNLRDNDGGYYAILRNFNFHVSIEKVTGNGSSTVAGAVESLGSGDIATDIKFLNVTNISDTESRLFISETARTVVSASTFSIKYKFIPDLNHPTVIDNDAVQFVVGDNDGHGDAFGADPMADEMDDSEGWRTLNIETTAPDANFPKTQTLTIQSALNGVKGVARTFTLTVRPTLKLTVSCDPRVAGTKGEAVPVTLGIENELPETIFPLNVLLEATALTLTPKTGENLPVTTGLSITGNGKSAFQFIKNISYAEYEAASTFTAGGVTYRSFICDFVTTTAQSTSMLYAQCDLFNLAACGFTTASKLSFDNVHFDDLRVGEGRSSNLIFSMMDASPVTITLVNATNGSVHQFSYTPAMAGIQTVPITLSTFGKHVEATLESSLYTTQYVSRYRYAVMEQNSYNITSIARKPCAFAKNSNTAEMDMMVGYNVGTPIISTKFAAKRVATGQTETVTIPQPTGSVSCERSSNGKNYTFTLTLTNYSIEYTYSYATTRTGTRTTIQPVSVDGKTAVFEFPKSQNSSLYFFVEGAARVQMVYDWGSVYLTGQTDGSITATKYNYSATGPVQRTVLDFDSDVEPDKMVYLYYNHENGRYTGSYQTTLQALDSGNRKDIVIY